MKRCLVIFGVLALAAVLVVKGLDREPVATAPGYPEALSQTASSVVPWIAPNSPEEAEAIDRFKNYWSQLTEDRVRELLPTVYAENIWFNDTVKTITSRADLMNYMVKTAGHVASCQVEVKDIATSEEGYYVRWEMHIVPKQADPGEVWSSIGLSHIRFNDEGLVVLHQDYWDSAGGMYEHLPGIGWLLRNIRARL
jgi:hypothetical protein